MTDEDKRALLMAAASLYPHLANAWTGPRFRESSSETRSKAIGIAMEIWRELGQEQARLQRIRDEVSRDPAGEWQDPWGDQGE